MTYSFDDSINTLEIGLEDSSSNNSAQNFDTIRHSFVNKTFTKLLELGSILNHKVDHLEDISVL